MTDPDVDVPDNARTQVLPRAPPRARFVVETSVDAGPPEEDVPETPLRATANLLRAIRNWWRAAPPDPRVARARTTLVLLRLEALRHLNAIEAIMDQLNDRKRR